jgi:hypothetical protein
MTSSNKYRTNTNKRRKRNYSKTQPASSQESLGLKKARMMPPGQELTTMEKRTIGIRELTIYYLLIFDNFHSFPNK